MKNEEKELSKKNLDYQSFQDDVLHINEGIQKTEEVWKKYQAYIQDLIVSNKIKDQAAKEIENRIEVLNTHWQAFNKAWGSTPLRSSVRDCDPFDPNSKQRNNVNKKQSLHCFSDKLTELHHLVQDYAYPLWFQRLYQFIKTNVLKLYNALFSGPGNLSAENVYITAANYGYAPTLPSFRLKKHNFFICHETLSENTALLQEDLTNIEIWQKASQLDINSPKR